MTKKKRQQSKILNFDFKNLGNVIEDYPFVEIEWLDAFNQVHNSTITTSIGKIKVEIDD